MSDSLTVGSVTLATTGEQTGRLLGTGASTVPGTFASLVRQTNNLVTYNGNYSVTGPAYTLVVPASAATVAAFVTGQQVAVEAGSAPITANIFGDGLASGAIGTVAQGIGGISNLIDVWGGGDSVIELALNATVAAGGAGNSVLLGGVDESLFVDSGSSGTYTETGHPNLSTHNDAVGGANIIVIGSFGTQQPTVSSGQTILDVNGSNFVDLIDPTAYEIVTAHQGANTIVATAGVATVFAAAGGDIYDGRGGNASLYFVGAATTASASSVAGGSGNATLFAETGVIYTEGGGNNVYVGGTATSTVHGSSGHDTLFGGTAGDLYETGGASEFYVNGGGVDTIGGGGIDTTGTGTIDPQHYRPVGPTVYGSSNGTDVITGISDGIFVASGSNDVLNAAHADQGNTFFALNVPGAGNSTLIGSVATPVGNTSDRFAVESVTGAANLPHRITIENFQQRDAFFLEGYSAADSQTFTQAVNTSNPSSTLTFTLSDNTTVLFIGQHPTGVFDNGTIAI